jgi:transcription-repair coupling factor (superfamily II helicase)
MAYDAKQIAKASGSLTLAGAPEGFDALVMADIARSRGGLTAFVARDTARASAFIDALKFFAPEIEAVLFPSWDCLPYDRIGPSAGVAATRMATLHRLAEGLGKDKPAILVTAAPALLQRVPEKAVLLRASYAAKVGNSSMCRTWNAISRSTATAAPRPFRSAASSRSAAA